MPLDPARAALAELLAVVEELERCKLCSVDADEHGNHAKRLTAAKRRARETLASAPN